MSDSLMDDPKAESLENLYLAPSLVLWLLPSYSVVSELCLAPWTEDLELSRYPLGFLYWFGTTESSILSDWAATTSFATHSIVRQTLLGYSELTVQSNLTNPPCNA